ncbi:ankyrin-3-like [Cotesia glomerata]|nr:ankyrin-3-like [Cotesia glomerata]
MATLSRNLKTAIHFGDVKEVKKLLKSSVKKPLSDNPLICGGYNLLKLAIGLRKKDIAKLLIKKGARVNKKHRDGSFSPLHFAVRQRYSDLVEELVKKGAEPNDFAHNNITPLYLTIGFLPDFQNQFPTVKIMKCLLNYGADPNLKFKRPDQNGFTSLYVSCHVESNQHVKLLLKNNVDVNARNGSNGVIPISLAVVSDSEESVKLTSSLLEYGAKPNFIISTGFIESSIDDGPIKERIKSFGNPTPLHATIANQDVEKVELLINYGADINYRTESFKRTPLMLAIEEYNPAIVELLLRKGARVDVSDEAGMSPLHYIISNPKNSNSPFSLDMLEEFEVEKLKILELLIRFGVNLDQTSFLTLAAAHGHRKIIERVLLRDVDLRRVDYTILQAAKLNLSLLSEDQISDQRFMERIFDVFKKTELCLIRAILRRHYTCGPVEGDILSRVRSTPVNDFWNHKNYIASVQAVEFRILQRLQKMKEDKIGDSNITVWHLLISSQDRLTNHVSHQDVRSVNIDQYRDQYHPYINKIKNRFNAALERRRLLDTSREILFNVFQNLPIECCDKVLTYLHHEHLSVINSQFNYIIDNNN